MKWCPGAFKCTLYNQWSSARLVYVFIIGLLMYWRYSSPTLGHQYHVLFCDGFLYQVTDYVNVKFPSFPASSFLFNAQWNLSASYTGCTMSILLNTNPMLSPSIDVISVLKYFMNHDSYCGYCCQCDDQIHSICTGQNPEFLLSSILRMFKIIYICQCFEAHMAISSHLFGTKSVPEPMLMYWQLNPQEQTI